jgi:hypothetical protein
LALLDWELLGTRGVIEGIWRHGIVVRVVGTGFYVNGQRIKGRGDGRTRTQ